LRRRARVASGSRVRRASSLQKAKKPNHGDAYDPHVIRGRDEWGRENTTPNTRLYRRGWK